MAEQRGAGTNQGKILPGSLFLMLCAGAVYGILLLPIPRQIGLTFRNTLYVFPVVFAAALACTLVRNRWVKALLLAVLFAMVLLPYSGLINSGASDQYALGGVIPWSDAFTMQLNTQRFLYGGQMAQSSAIRPLSLIFYGLFLRCFHNNYFALQVFLCVMTAFCLIAAMGSVRRVFGPVCASVFFTILFYYIRKRLGTYMTEPYGFICGLISGMLILDGVRSHKQILLLTGFLFLSVGLNARPAAMFLFPAIGLWYFFIFLKGYPHRFLLAAAALALMLSGFVLNRLAQKSVYGDRQIANRQAAEMVYGLCRGGESWGDVVALPEMVAIHNSDNIIRDVAELCGPLLKEHPENILLALKKIFWDSLIRSEYYGAFSFVNGNPKRLQTPVRYGLMAVWLTGVILLFRRRKEPVCALLLFSVSGILLSECAAVPFSTNYLRLYAVSMWIPACITGLLPQLIADRLLRGCQPILSDSGLLFSGVPVIFCGIPILFGAIFGAGILKAHPMERRNQISELQCGEGESLLITSVDPGSFIYLTDISSLPAEHIPYFRLPYVRQHFHDTASAEMFSFTDAIDTPTAVIRGIDLTNLRDVLIFAPLEMVEGRTGYARFCGKFMDPPILRSDRFFLPSSVVFPGEGL